MKTISIVLPAYGWRRGLRATIGRLSRQARPLPWRAEILVVLSPGARLSPAALDTGSRFVEVRVLEAGAAEADVRLIRTGVLASAGDFVLVLGADCSVPLAELNKLMPHFQRGAHVVIGSRYLGPGARRKHPWHRRLGHALVNFLVQQVLLTDIRDSRCGFKCFRGPVARQVYSMVQASGPGADLEALTLARHLGYTVVEVPVRWRPLRRRPAVRFRDACRFLMSLLRIRWRTLGWRRAAEQTV